jgi:hypothetical protein
VCSSTEMGALGASHLGTGDHGPKTDRSRPRSIPVNAVVLTYPLRQVNDALHCYEQLNPSISDLPSKIDPGVKTQRLLDRCQAGVFELWVPSSATTRGREVEDCP